MNGYRLLVFDWDGTLMDSQARIVACIQAAARDVGTAVPPPEIAFLESFAFPWAEIRERVQPASLQFVLLNEPELIPP